MNSHTTKALSLRSRALRLGFVPLTDCAPLVVAQELGFFKRYGLNVSLCRELGWAAVRDKIVTHELDAAQAVCGMPFAATLGIGSARCDCVTGLVLNLHGNAITLSTRLWDVGVRDAASLREYIKRTRGEQMLTFGVVFSVASHNFLLRNWLKSAGINPDRDVRIVVVPPPQMPVAIEAGHIDGCCVGEPWNTIAVQSHVGWCVGVSAELAPGHPEKVLVARRDFAENCAAEHEAMIAALLDGAEFCDQQENHGFILEMLAQPKYLDRPVSVLRPGLTGRFDFGRGRTGDIPNMLIFNRHDANVPSLEKASWIMQQMRISSIATGPELTPALIRCVFRQDIYDRACALRSLTQKANEPGLSQARLIVA